MLHWFFFKTRTVAVEMSRDLTIAWAYISRMVVDCDVTMVILTSSFQKSVIGFDIHCVPKKHVRKQVQVVALDR